MVESVLLVSAICGALGMLLLLTVLYCKCCIVSVETNTTNKKRNWWKEYKKRKNKMSKRMMPSYSYSKNGELTAELMLNICINCKTGRSMKELLPDINYRHNKYYSIVNDEHINEIIELRKLSNPSFKENFIDSILEYDLIMLCIETGVNNIHDDIMNNNNSETQVILSSSTPLTNHSSLPVQYNSVSNTMISNEYDLNTITGCTHCITDNTTTECILNFALSRIRQSIRHILINIKHPYILETLDVQFTPDSSVSIILRPYSNTGSVRDLIHQTQPKLNYRAKYTKHNKHGQPLSLNLIRLYGRQIIEGLLYFQRSNLPYFNLHCGNIIIQKNTVQLSGYENVYFNYTNRLHKQLFKYSSRSISTNGVDVTSFAWCLYEMITGKEINSTLDYSNATSFSSEEYTDVELIIRDILSGYKPIKLTNLLQYSLFSVSIPTEYQQISLKTSTTILKILNSINEHYNYCIYPFVSHDNFNDNEVFIDMLSENDSSNSSGWASDDDISSPEAASIAKLKSAPSTPSSSRARNERRRKRQGKKLNFN